jgi:hypothetical protein
MLVLRRNEGQWIELTHHSGDQLRIRVYNIRSGFPGQMDMAFEDPDHHFDIQRGERARLRRCEPRTVPLPSNAD